MPLKKRMLSKGKKPGGGGGPYLAMAIVCESTLEDKDGVVSAIRIVDTFKVQAKLPGSEEPIPPAALAYLSPIISFQIVISIKAGKAKGHRKLKIIPKTPSGQVIAETVVPITLDGPKEPRGANLRIATNLVVKEEGVYWIDVLLNEMLMTRMPVRVEFEKIGSTTASRTSGS